VTGCLLAFKSRETGLCSIGDQSRARVFVTALSRVENAAFGNGGGKPKESPARQFRHLEKMSEVGILESGAHEEKLEMDLSVASRRG
jgi:hypothetical protein